MKSIRHTGKFAAWNMRQRTKIQTIDDCTNVVQPEKSCEVRPSEQLLI
jgi:hypothetical protein